jgi:hypothetical protein
MRTLVLFALTLGSVAALASDASAFGRRKAKKSSAAVVYPSYSPCECGGYSGHGSYHGYSGSGYHHSGYPSGYSPGTYPHSSYYPGAYPHSTYPSAPILMPGVPVPGTGVVVPVPMPKK